MKSKLIKLASFSSATTLAVLLSACGGSSTTPPPATISSVTTDQLVYRKNMIMTVKGTNLNNGINLTNKACLQISELSGSTATQKTFSCKIVGVGTAPVIITDSASKSIYAGTVTVALTAQPRITMGTSLGNIVLELDPAKAPVTVDNFLNYTESGFYVNKIFHRVISTFMIQGGGFTADLVQATTAAPIVLEANNGLSNLRGTVAMARTGALNSATSQFFINVVDNVSLDTSSGGYAVFGKVVSGLDVVDKIKVVPTGARGGLTDVPATAVVINSMVQTQ